MAVMPPPKKGKKKRPNRVGRAVTLWLSGDVFEALERWRNSQPVPPVRTDIIERSIVLFLASQGVTVSPPEAS